ncbi:proton-conducting transporter membrane subunit [Halorutilales archaeon Cl-col2-1]
MSGQEQTTTVGQLPTPSTEEPRLPTVLTRLVWLLWILSCGALAAYLWNWSGEAWEVAGLVRVDGLTVVMWTTVTFFSGIVHSYSRRYMSGSRSIDSFFRRVFGFTVAVMVLVAADSFVLFGASWLAMGLVMSQLIGQFDGWQQARSAGSLARRYFVGSTALLGVGLVTVWLFTGVATVSGVASAVEKTSSTVLLFAATALVLAAMVQSALIPFHTWLLSSMTAPTPASALMHAGFVNAGGILLTRFAPIVTVDPGFMVATVVVGAVSALGGKILKSVQTDFKSTLGCSTVGQMGFMIMQAGLGFFGAAVTHLIIHGFYKAYQFLSSGGEVEHKSPKKSKPTGSVGFVDTVVVIATGLAGGGVFAALTGKGTKLDGGIVLALLVVLTVLRASLEVVRHSSLSAKLRYGVPVIALPAIGVYAAVYRVIEGVLAELPGVGQPAELTPIHLLVAVAFVVVYVGIESGVHKRSHRLYVALLNTTQPPSETLLTSKEEYNEY